MENLTPEQQLQQIEQDYQKRREAPAESESEYESMSRVAEDQIKQHEPSFQASSHEPVPTPTTETPSEVQQLVTEAFSRGIWQSIKSAHDSGDMALLDSFHAALSGELYDQLIANKKLKQVA